MNICEQEPGQQIDKAYYQRYIPVIRERNNSLNSATPPFVTVPM
ncbi:hypothetical protein [Mucilaginibacter gynuensis]